MKNNKAFTLIELLAVIVILAIIALIATPIVMDVINNAQKQAALDSAYAAVKAFEDAYTIHNLEITGGINTTGTLYNTTVTVKKTADAEPATDLTAVDQVLGADFVASTVKNATNFKTVNVVINNGKIQTGGSMTINGYTINGIGTGTLTATKN